MSKKFDLYLDAVIASKLKENNEIQFFRALRQASKDFDDCKNEITMTEGDCNENWQTY